MATKPTTEPKPAEGANAVDVRMQCLSLAAQNPMPVDRVTVAADRWAQYVLTGNQPAAEEG